MQITVIDHPLVKHKLSLMREADSSTYKFRTLTKELARLMAYEASRDFPIETISIQGWEGNQIEGIQIKGKTVTVVPILRAGLGMLDGVLDLIPTGKNTELGFLKLRFKSPNSSTSTLLTLPITNTTQQPSSEMAFALSVASFGETLKQSKYIGNWQLNDSKRLAQANIGNDPQGIRREFIKLIDLADSLQPSKK